MEMQIKNSPAEDELQQELQGTTVTKTTSSWKAFAQNTKPTKIWVEPREVLRYYNRTPCEQRFEYNANTM